MKDKTESAKAHSLRRWRRVRVFRHPTKQGVLIMAGHPDDDLPPGTLRNILQRAGLLGEV